MSYRPHPAEKAKIEKMMAVISGWQLVTHDTDVFNIAQAHVEKMVDGVRIATSAYCKHEREHKEPLACVVFNCVQDAMEHDKIPGEPPYERGKV